jgi:cyclase
MSRFPLRPPLLCLSIIVLLFLPGLAAQVGTRALTPNLFLVTGLPDAGNVVFLKTADGVIVVDSGDTVEQGRAVVEKALSTAGGPIRFVILTHYHGDHTFGLQSFPPGTVIIGQDRIVENIEKFSRADLSDYLENRAPQHLARLHAEVEALTAAKSPDLARKQKDLEAAQDRYDQAKRLRLVSPQVTFSREIIIRLGGETVRVSYPGPTHTDCSAAVYFETQKVLHLGDMLFYRLLPYIDGAAGSDTANWIAALRDYKRLDFEKVVPGHGEVTTKAALDEQVEFLTDLRREVKDALAQGLSVQEMKRRILLPKYKGFGYQDILPDDIEAVCGELKK